MRKWLAAAVVIPALFLLGAGYVHFAFSRLTVEPFYDGSRKVWGHRGYFKELEMNSLASLDRAFDLGAEGVELDIVFDEDAREYFVSREYPREGENSGLLSLEEVFRDMGERGYFWLDFKNLLRMTRRETRDAVGELGRLLDGFGLRERVIVESKDARNLALFSEAGIHTSYWINVDRGCSPLLAGARILRHKARFLYGKFSAVSMNYRNFTPGVQRSLGDVPVHLFTLNTESEVRKFLNDENVKIILSDEDFFSLEAGGKWGVFPRGKGTDAPPARQ